MQFPSFPAAMKSLRGISLPLLAALLLTLATPLATASDGELENIMQTEEFLDHLNAHSQETGSGQAASPAQADEEEVEAASVKDPWEGFNRSMHSFNIKADKYLVRPLAVAYDTVTPDTVQHRITSFFSNLQSPRTAVNELLQGRPLGAAQTLGRFAMNTTIGIGGLFDPAGAVDIPRSNEDFGQTLAVWGWEDSNYLVLPFFGPRTVRDVVGIVGDTPMAPLGYVENDTVAWGLKAVQLANTRTQLFALDDLRANALDDYVMVRDAWMQHRGQQIKEGAQAQQE